jgi:hypothetical protein
MKGKQDCSLSARSNPEGGARRKAYAPAGANPPCTRLMAGVEFCAQNVHIAPIAEVETTLWPVT